ncbi:hypothetical protein PCANC_11005 [Puccinia coronata f. sp. avenae]|uniref:Fungal-type protein kinase domain-containing protein n=1 Tax=Puccinia coronata f. sp. avenae TaxID=200324 RepID=A0A2N5USZ1_9BASI|nr:hypothetical protein PCANC_11005 [Puccinia coronata f. sp. avenae]
MLRNVTEKKAPYVARYHHHENVRVGSQEFDIESHVRRRINLTGSEKLKISSQTDSSDDSHKLNQFTNRVHRRLIVKDVGQPIWTVDSPLRLLKALKDCI